MPFVLKDTELKHNDPSFPQGGCPVSNPQADAQVSITSVVNMTNNTVHVLNPCNNSHS